MNLDFTNPHFVLPWLGVLGIVVFIVIESVVPQRQWNMKRWQHWLINFSLSLCNLIIVDQMFVSLITYTNILEPFSRFDLYGRLELNTFWRITLTIVLFDLLMYVWHRMNHRIPLLWRFHRVHHTDIDLDVSSASRFHFGETTMAAVLTYSLMLSLGATLLEVRIFKLFFVIMTEFQHSNIRLHPTIERWVWMIFVPPAMHRVHHSDIQKETDSNYGAIFSFWDRMFGTFCRVDDQDRIVFGLKEYKDPQQLTLWKLLTLPFRK